MTIDMHMTEYLPAYALDCLDEEETRIVYGHLQSCPQCRAELETYLAVAERLALAAPDAAPPARLKQQLMDCLKNE